MEQKNGDVVRRHAFRYCYDTAAELKLLTALYALVRVRLNLFDPDRGQSRRTRRAHGDHGITKIQSQLIALAAARTRALKASSSSCLT
ncbi:hypothetical protein [Pseudarthrobacter raffinosi]|uniref:hypothetical protein n=1 Tax=Pseudarthrobacter raffinosi TaxID=2953651 RepID=UPI00208F62F0|nr:MULTISPECIES: hypothetical protein [unclassified Pseudarthrobacter]MCO4238407.1 hypothetical protein [Pseudarthrobacter sp. MDT3-28]MCO4253601.1 hypothetical protein [Pseudarthrobacter sp. MDT3-9]MCO4265293.1 hypothetical protein [Pseudarthrobacter sp. MDT3-26]